jgi:hypothetical protein
MNKQLIRVGNSLALVIDKQFRSALCIGPSRRVRVTCNGIELVVRPIPESEPDTLNPIITPPKHSPGSILKALKLSEAEFATLHPTGGRMIRWMLRNTENPSDDALAVMPRFERALELLEAGIPRHVAIAVVAQLFRAESGDTGDTQIEPTGTPLPT